MVNFHIAFDGNDLSLGHYFEASKLDIVDFIQSESPNHIINEIPSNLCNQAYIDIRLPQVNNANYLFVVYSHGNHNSLVSNGAYYIKKDINSVLFTNAFFYSMSCLTGKELGTDLIANGCHAFIGFEEEAEALLGPYLQLSIDCDNHGLKNFIRGLPAGESFQMMKEHFTEKVDWLEANGEPLLAAFLAANRDCLIFEGNHNATFADFTIN